MTEMEWVEKRAKPNTAPVPSDTPMARIARYRAIMSNPRNRANGMALSCKLSYTQKRLKGKRVLW